MTSTDNNCTEQGKKETKICLLSPLGLSPGLLYSALLAVRPHIAAIVTSKEGEASLEEIVEKSGYQGEMVVLQVDDPFICFNEAPQIISKLLNIAKPDDRWVINLTGGTTGLQYIIQKAGEALLFSVNSIRYVAMVDRRSAEKQRADPWVVGELIEVENI